MQKPNNRLLKWEYATLFWLLLSALLPMYGSWLNLNFAALQPDHLHIYGEEVDLDHHREDELFAHKEDGHSHHHHETETTSDVTADSSPPSITYLPNLNSLLLILTAVFLTLLLPPLLLQLPRLVQLWVHSTQPIALIALPQPIDPPRVSKYSLSL